LRRDLADDLGRFAGAAALSEVMLKMAPPAPLPAAYEAFTLGLDALVKAEVGQSDAVAVRWLWLLVGVLGFAPQLDSNQEALDLLVEAIGKAGYAPGGDVSIELRPSEGDVEVVSGPARFHIRTLRSEDFPPLPEPGGDTVVTMPAEAFVQTVYQATGRFPLVYTHPSWADGRPSGRGRVRLREPISSNSVLARCDLWLADYREEPQVPSAWADRSWRLWQYSGDETESNAAYGSEPRAVAGVSHCDRNLFAGDTTALYRFWNGHA